MARTIVALLLVQLFAIPALADEKLSPADAGIGKVVDAFELQDFHGQPYQLAEMKQPVVVVVFLAVDCPLAQLYGGRLSELAESYDSKKVAFLAIDSNRHDTITEMSAYARKYELRTPFLKDTANRVADQFGAERTPEAYVLDAERKIRYRGRIDDQFGVGYAREQVESRDLKDAIDAVVAGKPVERPYTKAVGCHIGRIAKPDAESEITYANQVVRIINRHCVECHREGEIAPFQLTDYEEVVGWAETIDEVIQDQRMPPWHADPKVGSFQNERRMTDEEKAIITKWVEAGAPAGDLTKVPPLPPKRKSEWRLPRKPDRVVAMRKLPFRVPADGVVDYQYYVVDPKFTEDKWVQAAEVIPGNRRVVHHAIVFIKPPTTTELRGFGFLTGFVPGQSILEYPQGMARRIPAGSKLIFQMHYTPVGREVEDRTKIGLVFTDRETVKEEAFTMLIMNQDLEIEPHASNFPVDAELNDIPNGARLLSIAPHMHVRGKSFEVAVETGGETTKLLSVPNYDFNWQHAYALNEPVRLTPQTRILARATYDNSDGNLVNPDPSIRIRWGDQTWEEMMIAFLEMAAPVDQKLIDPRDAKRLALANKRADLFFAKHDRNKDGVVASRETPSAVSTFVFRDIDTNGDKLATREEVLKWALENSNRDPARFRYRSKKQELPREVH